MIRYIRLDYFMNNMQVQATAKTELDSNRNRESLIKLIPEIRNVYKYNINVINKVEHSYDTTKKEDRNLVIFASETANRLRKPHLLLTLKVL